MLRDSRALRWIILAVVAAPLFASSCVSNFRDFLDEESHRDDDVGDEIEDILDDIGDLVDDVF